MTNPDLVYACTWQFPRFGPHAFFLGLQSVFKAYYGLELEYTYYGKPNEVTYEYAESILKKKAER